MLQIFVVLLLKLRRNLMKFGSCENYFRKVLKKCSEM